MLRSVFAVLFVLMLGAGAAGAYWQLVMVPAEQSKQGPAAGRGGGRGGGGPVAVDVAEVQVAPSINAVTAVGTTLSTESVTVRPEVAGRIVNFNIQEGARVKAGTVIVELDSSMEQAELDQAKARLQLAESNLERARELRRTSAGTQRSLDEAQMSEKIADAEVKLATAKLAKRRIVAPFDAIARFRQVSVGEFVSAGTAIVGLEQIDPLEVDFRIPELFLRMLHVGQKIDLTLDAFPGESFGGTVRAIDPAIDERGRAVVIRAEVSNPGDQPRLRPGLFARVNLQLEQRPDALWIPEEALVPQGNQQLVFKVVPGTEPDSKIVKQTVVELGNRISGKVEIVRGLERGDSVVSAGVMKVRDNVAIRVAAPGGQPQNGERAPGGQERARGGAPVAAAGSGRPG